MNHRMVEVQGDLQQSFGPKSSIEFKQHKVLFSVLLGAPAASWGFSRHGDNVQPKQAQVTRQTQDNNQTENVPAPLPCISTDTSTTNLSASKTRPWLTSALTRADRPHIQLQTTTDLPSQGRFLCGTSSLCQTSACTIITMKLLIPEVTVQSYHAKTAETLWHLTAGTPMTSSCARNLQVDEADYNATKMKNVPPHSLVKPQMFSYEAIYYLILRFQWSLTFRFKRFLLGC